jgi:hypothetical protein
MTEQKSNGGKPQQTFQIGQIVYLLSDKAEAIVPAIVVEELTLKKLDGNTISWKMAVGPPDKKKILASTDLEGEIYTSLEEIRKVMVERLMGYVTNLISQAEKRTEIWYGKQMLAPVSMTEGGKIDPASLIESIDGIQDSQANKSMEGNYKIKAPPVQGPLKVNQQNYSNGNGSLRDRLLEMATPDDEDGNGGTDSAQGDFIILPNGQKVPVKVNIQQ